MSTKRLLAVVIIGAVGSHMPRWFRHAALGECLKRLAGWPRRPVGGRR